VNAIAQIATTSTAVAITASVAYLNRRLFGRARIEDMRLK
jgi:hypothetical protein